MGLLFRLPFLLLQALWRHLTGSDHDHEDARFTPAAPEAAATEPEMTPGGGATVTGTAASASADGAPPPTAGEAIERRFAREAADATRVTGRPGSPRPVGDAGHVDREAELVESFGPADDVGDRGGTLTVDEPWDGYAGQAAGAIVERLRGADPATKAVVALYERAHKNRATVLRAAG